MLSGILMLVIETVVGLITIMLLVRTVMRAMRLSFITPLGQFVLAITNWIVLPAQRLLPSVGKVELASLLPAWLLQCLMVLLGVVLTGAALGNPVFVAIGLALLGVLELFKLSLYLLLALVVLGAILSWVNPHAPIAPTVRYLTEPFLAPFRRIIPPIGGIDLSPIGLLLLLQIVLSFILPAVYGSFYPLLFR